MNKKNLSVIIPCFNCEKTLEEAVNSCFAQGLDNFEIILVDDASTDGTREVMKTLSLQHQEIRCFFHDVNKGGGATRNTAVDHAQADVIFCLDSDDILPKDTLIKMFLFMKEKDCDGVGIHRSIKFIGTDINAINVIHTFGYPGEKIPKESLLQKNNILCPLYSTFMFSKKSFTSIGGYPTSHGFDTQGFAWRFLMNGFTAYTCPDAEYLHRINFHESYYLREYNAGKINYNWQKVLEEFIFVFSREAQEIIITFNLSSVDKELINMVTELKNPWASDIDIHIQNSLSKSYEEKALASLGPVLYATMMKNKNTNFKPIRRDSIRGLLRRIEVKTNKYIAILSDVIQVRKGRPYLVISFFFLQVRKFLKIGFYHNQEVKTTVDVVIPTAVKDYALLVKMVEALRINLNHSINKVFIVAKDSSEIRDFCTTSDCIFIDEVSVLGYGKEKIEYVYDGLSRSGWLFQQLLKLSGDVFAESDNYIIVDADTLLINKHSFIMDNKFVFFENEEWNEPYFESYQKIFGYRPKNRLSFTSHMMIFNKEMLKEMKTEIENKHNMSWDSIYREIIDKKYMSAISDYDTYANWVFSNYPQNVVRLPLYNKTLPLTLLSDIDSLQKNYGTVYKSISFHGYVGKNIASLIQESAISK